MIPRNISEFYFRQEKKIFFFHAFSLFGPYYTTNAPVIVFYVYQFLQLLKEKVVFTKKMHIKLDNFHMEFIVLKYLRNILEQYVKIFWNFCSIAEIK